MSIFSVPSGDGAIRSEAHIEGAEGSPYQLSIDFAAAERRRDTGMRRSAERAERAEPGWLDLALDKLAEFASAAHEQFTIEKARAALDGQLPEPPGLRAWGAVTKAAIKRGIIVPAGMAPAASSNGSMKVAYARGKGCI